MKTIKNTAKKYTGLTIFVAVVVSELVINFIIF